MIVVMNSLKEPSFINDAVNMGRNEDSIATVKAGTMTELK